MSDRKYYVLCSSNCKFEGMTKEQILTAISQAVEMGEVKDIDTGFVTKIKEQNNGAGLSFWVGTQAEYNALDPKVNNCFYIITDDTTKADIERAIAALDGRVEEYKKQTDDTTLRFDKLQQALKPFGANLYEAGELEGVEVGKTFSCDTSRHQLFAVTVRASTSQEYVILCTRTLHAAKGGVSISGSSTITYANSLTPSYLRVGIAVDEENQKATVKIAQISETANFAATAASDFKIVKIVGIM